MKGAATHLPALRRYARSLTQDAESADDLVQQTLLRAIERSATFRTGMALRPWLFSILHNLFVSETRRAGAERRALDQFAGQPADREDGSDQGSRLRLQDVARRFERLPAGQREVLHLIVVEGMSYQEASDALSVPIGTVMSRLSRARAGLREGDDKNGPALRLIGGQDA
jgi:RNA polymerase sigma-70 factor (ECF subfamily)